MPTYRNEVTMSSDSQLPHGDPPSSFSELALLVANGPTALIRTDFSDDWTWSRIVTEATADFFQHGSVEPFNVILNPINDRRFESLSTADFMQFSPRPQQILFVVDAEAMVNREHAVLAIDMQDNPGAELRVVPSRIFEIENNVTGYNMCFAEFVPSAGSDGVFRGYMLT